MPSIRLLGIPPSDEQLIEGLVEPLRSILRLPVEIGSGWTLDPAFAFDPYRNQVNSSSIIGGFLQHFPTVDGKILGVTTSDLFVPVLTYVFGEAQLDGPIAVVSSHRLDDTLYGLPPNPDLLAQRLLKEAVHELGHTFGLIHCRDYRCVMHTSTAAEDIDIKSERFCPACESAVSKKRSEMMNG
ncbi:MAG TPA: archaemetzincin family Zn-dependent metalloprotease [Bacteroidota bacterium]|nr:archaemetzincin family Zn-dependent metalloprotease [Bacteroidota bacterium]